MTRDILRCKTTHCETRVKVQIINQFTQHVFVIQFNTEYVSSWFLWLYFNTICSIIVVSQGHWDIKAIRILAIYGQITWNQSG